MEDSSDSILADVTTAAVVQDVEAVDGVLAVDAELLSGVVLLSKDGSSVINLGDATTIVDGSLCEGDENIIVATEQVGTESDAPNVTVAKDQDEVSSKNDKENVVEFNESLVTVAEVDITNPIPLSHNVIATINGQKCILQQDPSSGEMVAFPVLDSLKRKPGKPRKPQSEEISVGDLEKHESDNAEASAVQGLLELHNTEGEVVKRSARKKKIPKKFKDDYEVKPKNQQKPDAVMSTDEEESVGEEDDNDVVQKSTPEHRGMKRKQTSPSKPKSDSVADGKQKKVRLHKPEETGPSSAQNVPVVVVQTSEGKTIVVQPPLDNSTEDSALGEEDKESFSEAAGGGSTPDASRKNEHLSLNKDLTNLTVITQTAADLAVRFQDKLDDLKLSIDYAINNIFKDCTRDNLQHLLKVTCDDTWDSFSHDDRSIFLSMYRWLFDESRQEEDAKKCHNLVGKLCGQSTFTLAPATTSSTKSKNQELAEKEKEVCYENGQQYQEPKHSNLISTSDASDKTNTNVNATTSDRSQLSEVEPLSTDPKIVHVESVLNNQNYEIEEVNVQEHHLDQPLHLTVLLAVDNYEIAARFKAKLAHLKISQRQAAANILHISQGYLCDLINHPRPWNSITHESKLHYYDMQNWLEQYEDADEWVAIDLKQLISFSSKNESSANSRKKVQMDMTSSDTQKDISVRSEVSPPLAENNGNKAAAATDVDSNNQIIYAVKDENSEHGEYYIVVESADDTSLITTQEEGVQVQPEESQHDVSHDFVDDLGSEETVVGSTEKCDVVLELEDPTAVLDTKSVASQFKNRLEELGIGQRFTAQYIIKHHLKSQGHLADLLNHPRPWHRCAAPVQQIYLRMCVWLQDESLQREDAYKYHSIPKGKRGKQVGPVTKPTRVTPQQLYILENEFKKNEYLSKEDAEDMSKVLSLPIRVIRNWFNNRRARSK